MRKRLLVGCALVFVSVSVSVDAHAAAPTLDDYRHFRALTVDLVGRLPTRAEVAAFEAPGFDVETWVDAHLTGPAYSDRVSRVYMDLLRLQLAPGVTVQPNVTAFRREPVIGPDGKPLTVFFRPGQRRVRPETDGDFCLTADETGLQFPSGTAPIVFPKGAARTIGTPVSQAVLDARTVLVKPWWLYRDYKSANPSDRYDAATWATSHPGFSPSAALLMDPDGKTQTTSVRVCKEEASGGADTGTVYASGRLTNGAVNGLPPYNRLTFPPVDSAYAKTHAGETISCHSQTGFLHAVDCGCGAGVENCAPATGPNLETAVLVQPAVNVLGAESPVDSATQSGSAWQRLWWGEEARHFLKEVLGGDRDFREILTAPYTFVNGPLAQFYKHSASGTCCGNGVSFGLTQPDPLLVPSAVPAGLLPHDARVWMKVDDRGPHASGIMTMPIFLTKFGTRRARAHVLYNAFLCKDFIAPPNLQLTASTDPNLMTRPGCASCHTTLEPMAAYFSRILESDWTFLPPDKFPVDTKASCGDAGPQPFFCGCKKSAKGTLSGACNSYYDPAFSDTTHATLRGAYPDSVNGSTTTHAALGPQGLAAELLAQPEFAGCVAENVASSFLGRPLDAEDAALRATLTQALTGGNFRMRALVRAMVLSDVYRHSNNLSSTAWRNGGAK